MCNKAGRRRPSGIEEVHCSGFKKRRRSRCASRAAPTTVTSHMGLPPPVAAAAAPSRHPTNRLTLPSSGQVMTDTSLSATADESTHNIAEDDCSVGRRGTAPPPILPNCNKALPRDLSNVRLGMPRLDLSTHVPYPGCPCLSHAARRPRHRARPLCAAMYPVLYASI